MKPRLFIGSSTERLPIAKELKRGLDACSEVVIWDEAPEFDLGESILDGLIKVGNLYDFALFVVGPDDSSIVRGTEHQIVRDNVVFELGLLMGRIGRGRALWLSPKGEGTLHTPSDLDGIVHLMFNEPDSTASTALSVAVADTCARICRHIKNKGPRNDGPVHQVTMNQALCLASKQYSEARFKKDIEYIHEFFSQRLVTSEQGVSAEHFQKYFMPGKYWDIVHLGLFVDKDNGRMLFDSPSGVGTTESLGVEAIEGMIKACRASLVVIITCDSLRFGERLARFTNVVAGHQPIAPQAALDWAKVFYQSLSLGEPLSQSFYRAQDQADPGLILMARKDVCFRPTA